MKTFLKFSVVLFCLFQACDAYSACSVSTTGLNFGSYDVFLNTPLDSTGSVTVACDETPPPDVTISIGRSNGSGGFNPRKMKHSSMSDLLNYNLFTNSSMTVVWGDGTSGTSTVVLSKVKKNEPPRQTTIFGRIPAGQDVSAGSYSDTVTVTILW